MSPPPVVLRVTRRFAASAERVFDAWLDPGSARLWWFATPGGTMERVEIDGRVGGRFVIAERRGALLAEHVGTFLELERPRRLVFSFATDREQAPTRVTVEIAPLPNGGCELTLRHEMSPEWTSHAGRTRAGWTSILVGLARCVQGAEPAIREVVYIRTSAEALWHALTNADSTERYWGGTRIESEWSVGALIRHRRGGEVMDEHTILAVEPPALLVHTFEPRFGELAAEPPSLVTLRLAAQGPVARLELVHDGFPPGSRVAPACREGWPRILSSLKSLLETGEALEGI